MLNSTTASTSLFFFLYFLCGRNNEVVQASYLAELDKALEDKALESSHVFQTTLNDVTSLGCFTSCALHCRCMAFQICQQTECQLLTTTRFLYPSALQHATGCKYYDMLPRKLPEGEKSTCAPDCCQTSNPCQNGGRCLPSPPTLNQTRFNCSCSRGFGGERCEGVLPHSCRGVAKIPAIAGKYALRNNSGDTFETFCDFNDSTSMAWTLIQSYELQNTHLVDEPLYRNSPVNESTPSWQAFRLSLPVMQSIASDSLKLRITCNYDQDGVIYRDYATALLDDIPIVSYKNRKCSKYEYINIRGHSCTSCSAHTKQGDPGAMFHVDVNNTYGARCDLYPPGIMFCESGLSEDNFGLYRCINPAHRCSSSETATTQIWLGGPIQLPGT